MIDACGDWVPLHLWPFDSVGQKHNPAREDAEAWLFGTFIAAVEQHLHAHTDAEEGPFVSGRVDGDLGQASVM